MSVSATNCRRLCQCFLQKHCFGCSGLIAVPVFLLRKILVSIQQFRGGQCFPYVKHWLPFAWGSVLPYRKHCFPFECFSFAFRSAVQDGAVFPLTLRKALLSIRVFSYEKHFFPFGCSGLVTSVSPCEKLLSVGYSRWLLTCFLNTA